MSLLPEHNADDQLVDEAVEAVLEHDAELLVEEAFEHDAELLVEEAFEHDAELLVEEAFEHDAEADVEEVFAPWWRRAIRRVGRFLRRRRSHRLSFMDPSQMDRETKKRNF